MSTISVSADYDVASNQTLTFTADSGTPVYTIDGGIPSPNFTDDGSIQINSSQSNATVEAFADNGFENNPVSLINISAGATLSVSATGSGSTAEGYYSRGAPAKFENDGIFGVSGVLTAIGVLQNDAILVSANPLFNNTGQFTVSANYAWGVEDGYTGYSANSGHFEVDGISQAVAFELGSFVSSGGLTNSSTGVITATATSGTSYGIKYSGAYGTGNLVINNAGAITAQYAIYSYSNTSPSDTPILLLTNSGTITGEIDLGQGPPSYFSLGFTPGDTITNTGAIHGAIHFTTDGNDLYDGRGGTQTGGLYLGAGKDTVYLGNDGETVIGSTGTAVVYGGSGADVITGGSGADIINGGGGADTLAGGGGGDTFTFTTAVGAAVITDFSHAQGDKINLAGLDQFTSLAALQAMMTQSNSDTIISLGGGATITLQNVTESTLTAADFVLGPFTVDGAQTEAYGTNLTFEASGAAYILIDAPFATSSLTILGQVTVSSSQASAAGLGLTDTGILAGDTISVDVGGTGNLTVDLTGSGSTAIGYLSPSTAYAPTILNEGHFEVDAVQQAVGVSLGQGGSVTNEGIYEVAGGDAIGVAGNYASGAYGAADTSFSNTTNFTVTGGSSAIGVLIGEGSVTNSGSISVMASSGTAVGIETNGTAFSVTIANSGTITAQTAILGNGAFSLENTGTINGDITLTGYNTTGTTIVNDAFIYGNVTLGTATATLMSHGSISGTVTLGNGAQTVTLGSENNTVFSGAGVHIVDGGGGINTISYANANSAVTVSLAAQGSAQYDGVGTDTLSNFQNLIGSRFNDTLVTTFTGTSSLTGGLGADTFRAASAASNGTITDFSHTQGDKIDLTGLSQFHSLGDVMASATQSGANTIINLGGGGSLTLDNVTATSLTALDFEFSSTTTYSTLPYPFDCVCLITDVIGGVAYRASGVIVGPHTILTAAHVVWSQGVGTASSLEIYPGYANAVTPLAAGIADVHYNAVNDANDLISQQQSQSDFAIIDVAQNLAPYGWFGISPNYAGGVASITGYPAANGWVQQDTSGTVTKDPTYSLIDYSNAFDVSGGSSGGPIWINKGTNTNPAPYVVGLVSTGSWGAQITTADLNEINGWVRQDASLWHVSGDLTGAGVADVIFRSNSGDWGFEAMNLGGGSGTWVDMGYSNPAYPVVGKGDFNGDGVADVAFRNNATGDWGTS